MGDCEHGTLAVTTSEKKIQHLKKKKTKYTKAKILITLKIENIT